MPGPLVVPVLGATGLATGIAGPSRDLLISGMAGGPLLFGMLMIWLLSNIPQEAISSLLKQSSLDHSRVFSTM